MSNSLGNQIKHIRNQKGFSQELLSEKTELSLRTIQRVENAETEPRGDTLLRIAEALQVTPDELLEWNKTEDNSYLMVMNLTQFSFIFFPLLGVLIPLLLWILKRKTIDKVDEIGKKILNFQITWSVIVFSGAIIYFIYVGRLAFNDIGAYFNAIETSMFTFQIFAVTVILYNIFIIIFNTVRIRKNNRVFFQPAIPFLR